MNATDPSELVREHACFAQAIAYRIHKEYRAPCTVGDLTGYAYAGLLEAGQSFDAVRGVAFRTFAYSRVRGAVLDGVRSMMPLGRGSHRQLEAARRTLEAPSDAESTEAAHRTIGSLSLRSVASALGHEPITFAVPACTEVDPRDEDPPGTFAAADSKSPEDEIDRAQQWTLIERAIASLTPQEQIVLRGMYFEERPLESIGAELGLSRSWACRIHKRAIARLERAAR